MGKKSESHIWPLTEDGRGRHLETIKKKRGGVNGGEKVLQLNKKKPKKKKPTTDCLARLRTINEQKGFPGRKEASTATEIRHSCGAGRTSDFKKGGSALRLADLIIFEREFLEKKKTASNKWARKSMGSKAQG